MTDFRLEVFIAVAQNLSFTKASAELRISQPAISKHISEIEANYGVQLFERSQNRVRLSSEGEIFLRHALKIHDGYRELLFEMNQLSKRDSGRINIGASTTIANYILPKIMAKYLAQHQDVELSLVSGNSEQIEDLVTRRKCDIGIIEGVAPRGEHKLSLFAEDELVLIASSKINPPKKISIEELKNLPILLREQGSGTLDVITRELKNKGIALRHLNIIMQLGSSEAIKRLIVGSEFYAIISQAAIREELARGELCVTKIEGLQFKRELSFITSSGNQDRLVDVFIDFLQDNYNQKL